MENPIQAEKPPQRAFALRRARAHPLPFLSTHPASLHRTRAHPLPFLSTQIISPLLCPPFRLTHQPSPPLNPPFQTTHSVSSRRRTYFRDPTPTHRRGTEPGLRKRLSHHLTAPILRHPPWETSAPPALEHWTRTNRPHTMPPHPARIAPHS